MTGTAKPKRLKILFLCTEDPDAVERGGSERRVALEIYRRLGLFTSLPIASLDRLRLEAMTKALGAN